MTGIHVGLGVDPTHRTFHRGGKSIIHDWIFGEEASNTRDDQGVDDGLNRVNMPHISHSRRSVWGRDTIEPGDCEGCVVITLVPERASKVSELS